MMTKNCLWAAFVLSLLVLAGCSGNGKNGNGAARVAVSPPGQTAVGVTLQQQYTATVTGVADQAVTWKITQNNAACSPGCGSIDANGLYTAPVGIPNPATVTVIATSVANDGEFDSATAKVVPITVSISPTPANVGVTLQQQFQATAVPDNAPQVFSWAVTCTAGDCGNVVADQNNSALAVYTAPVSPPNPANSVQVTATWSQKGATGNGSADVTILSSRLPTGTFAFRFSGYDAAGPIAVVGSFTSNGDGTISGGVEDELTSSGPAHHVLSASTYTFTPNPNNPDANAQGSITLKPNGVAANTYTMVLDAAGDIQIVESTSDGTGRHGSGVIQPSTGIAASALKGSFVFGLAGADSSLKRVGSAGALTFDGSLNITGGMLDVNDNGAVSGPTNITATGSAYTMANGIGTMTIVANGLSFHFALYGVSGQTKAKTANPLTLYAISTDPIDSSHPAISGTLVFQDPNGQPYDNTTLSGPAVSNLTGTDSTGANTNVSLTLAGADGKGNLGGSFDQNNAGTIVSVTSFTSTYSASPAGSGRYTLGLLGNPTAVHFVLYASSASRGFLLEVEPNDPAVMTGTMDPQKGTFFAPSAIAGSYAAGTISSGTSSVSPLVANLLLTSVGHTVTGTQFVSGAGSQVTGTYDVTVGGQGTITLTAPPPPSSANFVIYLLDTSHFMILNVDKTNPNPASSIVFAQQ